MCHKYIFTIRSFLFKSLIHFNLDQYFCFHTIKEKDVPNCHLGLDNHPQAVRIRECPRFSLAPL